MVEVEVIRRAHFDTLVRAPEVVAAFHSPEILYHARQLGAPVLHEHLP
jgi:hypothetical protein